MVMDGWLPFSFIHFGALGVRLGAPGELKPRSICESIAFTRIRVTRILAKHSTKILAERFKELRSPKISFYNHSPYTPQLLKLLVKNRTHSIPSNSISSNL